MLYLANDVVQMRVRRRNVHVVLDILLYGVRIQAQRPLQLLRGVLATCHCVVVNLSYTMRNIVSTEQCTSYCLLIVRI